jgi:hypothetical protein
MLGTDAMICGESETGWLMFWPRHVHQMAKQFICTVIVTVLSQAQIQKQHLSKNAKSNAEPKQLMR